MQKKILSVIGISFLVMSCLTLTTTLSSCDSIKKKMASLTGSDELKTDSIVFHKEADHANVHCYVDYPTDGNELLVNAIQEYVNEQLGGTFDGDPNDGQQLVSVYGEGEWNNLKDEYKDLVADGEGDWMDDVSFYTDVDIRKVYETEKVVTYITTTDTYLGGAHGMQSQTGVTFRKSDGRRFGYDMMRQLLSEEFYQETKEGLRTYFKEAGADAQTDAELKDWLLTDDDINSLSHPKADPYMTEKGVEFLYQPYEIAPYAAGMPSFTLSYQDIKPFLTIGAQKMIP